MTRTLHTPHADFPYHVSARSHAGSWFRISPDQNWELMTRHLYFITFAFGVRIHSFVLMSNHFHMLISTPNANLSEAMNFFMRETSKEMNRISGSVNQVYGGRYSRTLIDSQLYFSSAYKYVYRNPVKAGLSETCEEYPYSTLNGVIGLGLVRVPTTEDTFLFGTGVENTLKWLNTAPSDIDYDIFKIGLKRKILKFPRNKWAPVRHALDKRPL